MRISESRYILGQTQNQQNHDFSGKDDSGRPSLQVSVNHGFIEREKKISPTNKVISKQDLVMQSLENSMESSVHSSSNNAQCEEDVSSSHIDTDKPHMSINPSLT